MKKSLLSSIAENQSTSLEKAPVSVVKKDEHLEQFCQNISQLKEQARKLSFIMSEINSVLKNTTSI